MYAVNPILYEFAKPAADSIDWLCKELGECTGALEVAGHPIERAQVGVGREAEHGSVDSVERLGPPAAALGQSTGEQP